MKVILQKDIPNLGDAGDVKEVADGYARNFLLPKRLVIQYNESSERAIRHQKKLINFKKEKRRSQSEKMAESVANLEIKIIAQVGEEDKLFGSVTSMDIAKHLAEKGYQVDKRKIQLDEPIKKKGEYEVPVKLDEGVAATIKVIVDKE
ncbi:MAG: 50S ribosomal protein L9 [Spirochaetota bacterium]